MEATRNYNLSMVRGDTLSFGFEVMGVSSIDAAYFSCKINPDDAEYIFQKSLNNGITVGNSTMGQYIVRVAPEDTYNVDLGTSYFDLEIWKNNDIYTILRGSLRIEKDITRELNT